MKLSINKMTQMAVLIAINIILGKISIGPAFAQVNFGFVALVVAGYFYGPKLTCITAGLSNIIAFTILGSGAFSIWFLIPAFLAGASYGLLIKPSILRIILVNIIVVVGIIFLLNSILIALVYHMQYAPLLATRIIKTIVSLIIQIIVSILLLKNSAIIRLKNKINLYDR